MFGTIVNKEKKLYLRVEFPDYEKPFMIIVYYSFGVRARSHRQHVGKRVRQSLSGGGLYHDDNGLAFRLEHGGQTVPDKRYTEEEPIPRPKTRLETKYRYGQWEKLTKKGWKPA